MLRTMTALWIALQLLLPASAMAQAETEPDWVFEEEQSQIEGVRIDLVRGEAMVVRRAGPLSIRISNHSATGKSGKVSLRMINEGGVLEITDIYPANTYNMWRECLPITARGNFFTSDARFRATIYAPENIEVSVTFMDGHTALAPVTESEI